MSRNTVPTATFGDIAYAAFGSGPEALFIHGVFLNADLWRHQIAALSDIRRCLGVDLLAHGESPSPSGHLTISVQAAMVIEFLDALGIEKIDLVGNDTGGAIAQMIATTQPGRVRSLTLTNCDVHDNFPPEAFLPIQDLARQEQLAGALGALANDADAIRSVLATSLEKPESLPDDVLVGFFRAFTAHDKALAVQDYVAGMEPSEMVALFDRLTRLSSPTLIVWGTDDVFFPVSWAQWLETTIPSVVNSVRIEGARLLFPLERPEELTNELRSFWNS